MPVLSSGLQISVPKQNLDGPQVGARFQQVGGPTVTQSMRRDAFVDAGPTGRVAAYDPDGLIGDRLECARVLLSQPSGFPYNVRQCLPE
jgi:hypothetical protein